MHNENDGSFCLILGSRKNNNSILKIRKVLCDKRLYMYLCGPTVYDNIHLGNIRGVFCFDVIQRILIFNNINYLYVHNITDVDDKIIEKSIKEKKSEKDVSEYYILKYLSLFKKCNLIIPNILPKVSDNIPGIINFIERIISKKNAYLKDGTVWFNTKKMLKNYGKVSKKVNKKTFSQSEEKDSYNFSLWKKTDIGIKWKSPWGEGRPGWHTECSFFIDKYFDNKTIDIHGGGSDLLFPHNENENIQFLSINNIPLSKFWFSFGSITINGEKMSKSKGNVILVEEFIKKYGKDVLRYLILDNHYENEIKISDLLISQTLKRLNKIKEVVKKVRFLIFTKYRKVNFKKKELINISFFKIKIMKILSNNLDCQKVFLNIEQLIKLTNKFIDNKSKKKIYSFFVNTKIIKFILNITGFEDLNKNIFKDYSRKNKQLILDWLNSLKVSDYTISDKLRKKLKEMEIL